MKILLLDNYDSFTFNLLHYLQKYDGVVVDVFRNDAITVKEVAVYDAIVLSPGPGLPQQSGIMMELINEYKSQKKILGVCLGLQAIAVSFGYELYNLETVQHGVARKTFLNAPDSLFDEIPQDFICGRYHSWVVKNNDDNKNLITTATDESNYIMAMKHSEYNLRGVQFHPESILTEHGDQMIYNWLFKC